MTDIGMKMKNEISAQTGLKSFAIVVITEIQLYEMHYVQD